MGDKTNIEWSDATWNPLIGCSRVSEGCRMCYAERLAGTRLAHLPAYKGTTRQTSNGPRWNGNINVVEERLDQPLRWTKPRRIFVNSMSDLFHENVPTEVIDRIWAVMVLAPHHIFQVLTKRPERMKAYLTDPALYNRVLTVADQLRRERPKLLEIGISDPSLGLASWIHIGVSVEDQATADERIPLLLQTPARVRWISAEPLLGPVSLHRWTSHDRQALIRRNGRWGTCVACPRRDGRVWPEECSETERYDHNLAPDHRLDWVVVGGESGPGSRPMQPTWARDLRDQCIHQGIAFHFKQWGAHNERGARVGKKASGRLLDGRTWDEQPRLP